MGKWPLVKQWAGVTTARPAKTGSRGGDGDGLDLPGFGNLAGLVSCKSSLSVRLLLSSVLCLGGVLVSPWAYAGLQDGLVAHWSFDDCTAKDVSGNGHDGTINGNPQCVNGTKGKAFNFNGISDYIHVQHAPSLNMAQTISYGGWVNLTEFINSDSNPIIINKEGIPFELAIHNIETASICVPDTIPQYNFSFYIDIQKKLSICWEDGGKKVDKNTWTHLFVTYDGTQVKTYYNGVLARTIAIAGAITN